ncbi:MAG: (E)-4-hydroxy-3-methylbut-2-enyl-diphosphate synthase [Bacteroidota bacterium]
MRYPQKYCESLISYHRIKTREVRIGHLPMGGGHPIRLQSMTNTDTNDKKATVSQIKKIADAGADIARMTTRTHKEAQNLKNIKDQLRQEGYDIPLVADVHFNSEIANTAAQHVEKVRINPGNFAVRYSRRGDMEKMRKHFIDLIETCKTCDTALRIGVNHGSLSQRIMDLYGDTPDGMTESALEFLDICEEQRFHNVVISMKSSNTRIMVQANRLLVNRMLQRGNVYPLHLGVTEAGEGEDARIKSAIGIATLLNDGIGDTIRVSLTESPEKEIPVARMIATYTSTRKKAGKLPDIDEMPINPFGYKRRRTQQALFIGGEYPPVVVGHKAVTGQLKPDLIMQGKQTGEQTPLDTPVIIPYTQWQKKTAPQNHLPLFDSLAHFLISEWQNTQPCFVKSSVDEMDKLKQLSSPKNTVFLLEGHTDHPAPGQRRFIFELMNLGLDIPVLLHARYRQNDIEALQLKAASDLGLLFIDGLADGLFIENEGQIPDEQLLNLSFGILQASRSRIFKTEFISCPGCGRTQFNLEDTAAKIRQRLGHLKGLKIAVMGCIVNGPGEMADADYGYVGAGPGKITLYRNKKIVKKNIAEDQAVEELVRLIRENGDWKEK